MQTNLKALSRPLSTDEIDFRIQSINKGGYVQMLAYKDARVDMQRLDECFGVFGWRREHYMLKDTLYCKVSIYDHDTKQWVDKSDVGTESFTEAIKGQASDSFKRACFNLGIGRELYDYPQIKFKLFDDEYTIYNEKARPSFNLKLKEWSWFSEFDSENKLVKLKAMDHVFRVRFNWEKKTEANVF
jgi:hypothetical protein